MDSTKSAAHNKYMPGHTKVKHHEWRTAENSAAFLLPVLQSMAQTKPKLTLLDVGAGSGTITATLAKYMPQGHITAVDISTDILKSAADYATKQGVTAIDFKVGDIYALPFEDNTFDVVHASQVLSHLDGPVEAYKEMIRVTKPGGMVASRESDLTMWSCYPESPEIKRYHEIILKIIPASGGHISAGPRLVSWAMQAGAKREQITASMGTWTYSTPEERAMFGGALADRFRGGGMTDKVLEMRLANEEELETMTKAWEEWAATEDGVHGSMHGEILIRK